MTGGDRLAALELRVSVLEEACVSNLRAYEQERTALAERIVERLNGEAQVRRMDRAAGVDPAKTDAELWPAHLPHPEGE